MANYPAFTLGLMNSKPGSIARRFPNFWNDGEGGIDWSAPTGTPVVALADGEIVGAGYFCNSTHQYALTSDSGACGHGVVTTRVLNADGSQTDLYYQHIILNSSIMPCFHGKASCGGQTVKKGQVIGYISNFGMLEMGVNVGNGPNPPPYPRGWGGIWGADPSPGPHVDPENYLRALISGQDTTGVLNSPGLPQGMQVSNPIDVLKPLTDLIASLGGLWAWVKQPTRLIKMVTGITLVLLGTYMLIVPDATKKVGKFIQSNPELLAA